MGRRRSGLNSLSPECEYSYPSSKRRGMHTRRITITRSIGAILMDCCGVGSHSGALAALTPTIAQVRCPLALSVCCPLTFQTHLDDDEEHPRGCAADARQQQDRSTGGTRPREKVRVRVRHAGSSAQRTIATRIAQPRVRDTRTSTNKIHLHKGR